jgi:7-cyano-7-deazaguanine synthase
MLCKELNLDFDEVYARTNTSYKPIWIPGPESTSRVEETLRTKWGEWFSDYKSASSVERIEAFIKLGRPDPVNYADETGPVAWEIAKSHVEKILKEHEA